MWRISESRRSAAGIIIKSLFTPFNCPKGDPIDFSLTFLLLWLRGTAEDSLSLSLSVVTAERFRNAPAAKNLCARNAQRARAQIRKTIKTSYGFTRVMNHAWIFQGRSKFFTVDEKFYFPLSTERERERERVREFS